MVIIIEIIRNDTDIIRRMELQSIVPVLDRIYEILGRDADLSVRVAWPDGSISDMRQREYGVVRTVFTKDSPRRRRARA